MAVETIFLALDDKIAKEFHKSAERMEEYPHDFGKMRELRIILQNLCGITEIEAHNVLIYRNISDYVSKYGGKADGMGIEQKNWLVPKTKRDWTGAV